MAVTLVKEIWTRGREGSYDLKAERTYTRVHQVFTSLVSDDAFVVLAGTGVPRPGDVHPNDLGAYCRKVTPRQDDEHPQVWYVTSEYSSKYENPDLNEENPTYRPSELNWDFVSYQRPLERDLTGAPIVSSSGEPFDPPVEIDDSRLVLTIVRNELDFDPALALLYQDAVNSDNFLGTYPGQAKVRLKAARQFETGLFFWRTTYEVQFRREGWDIEVLDRGFYEKYDGRRVPIYDTETHQQVTAPALLNGAGRKLTGDKAPGPAPREPLNVELAGGGGSGGSLQAGEYQVAYTYTYAGGEGPKGPDSAVFTVTGGEIPTVWSTVLEEPPHNATGMNIYITSLGTDPSSYLQYSAGHASFIDSESPLTLSAAYDANAAQPPQYSTPHWRRFRGYKYLPFAPLNLP